MQFIGLTVIILGSFVTLILSSLLKLSGKPIPKWFEPATLISFLALGLLIFSFDEARVFVSKLNLYHVIFLIIIGFISIQFATLKSRRKNH